MLTPRALWDANQTRYQLVQANPGIYNWLFVPGGPGLDSHYLRGLIANLTLPGNTWLVDFPENGSNRLKDTSQFEFECWSTCILDTAKLFPNPIYVGHSFGGTFPLLFPALEKLLCGYVMLNAAPCLWLEESSKMAAAKQITFDMDCITAFEKNPNQATFRTALEASFASYFPSHSLERGKQIFTDLPLNYHACLWGLQKFVQMNFTAEWIPQTLPTLIISGAEDCAAPYYLFESDQRFQRENIKFTVIENAGHAPWVEAMDEVKAEFNQFISRLTS
jgi:pimeloyl-ACP methyl ester carboxylesterase